LERRGVHRPALLIATAFALVLVLFGLLRAGRLAGTPLDALAGLATALYIGATILAGLMLIRRGAPFRRFGFDRPFEPVRHLALAFAAIVALQLLSMVLEPLWASLFGGGRDLGRFADVPGSPGGLVRLLALSWTVAAFGEEIAFRIVLMGGLVFAFGGGRGACVAALVIQALVFGLVHLYQGPAGVAATAINGLVYGGVVLAARGSIWPAAIAHGGANTIGILRLYLSG
jgi:hypothetical protein